MNSFRSHKFWSRLGSDDAEKEPQMGADTEPFSLHKMLPACSVHYCTSQFCILTCGKSSPGRGSLSMASF